MTRLATMRTIPSCLCGGSNGAPFSRSCARTERRNHNEVWSYGKQAEPILAKYLKLRYQLLPYTYSVAYRSYQTGAPYMRALFMDFPEDPKAADIPDEYMYGPAFLVAPVTEQGATHRTVYLPAGCDWYNYWTQ